MSVSVIVPTNPAEPPAFPMSEPQEIACVPAPSVVV